MLGEAACIGSLLDTAGGYDRPGPPGAHPKSLVGWFCTTTLVQSRCERSHAVVHPRSHRRLKKILTPADPKDERPQRLQGRALLRQATHRSIAEPTPSRLDGNSCHQSCGTPDHVHHRRPCKVHRPAPRQERETLVVFSVRAGPAVLMPRPVHNLMFRGAISRLRFGSVRVLQTEIHTCVHPAILRRQIEVAVRFAISKRKCVSIYRLV